jgi:hypothetical protein
MTEIAGDLKERFDFAVLWFHEKCELDANSLLDEHATRAVKICPKTSIIDRELLWLKLCSGATHRSGPAAIFVVNPLFVRSYLGPGIGSHPHWGWDPIC